MRTHSGREKGVRTGGAAGRLRECNNTEFVWKLSKREFCEDGFE